MRILYLLHSSGGSEGSSIAALSIIKNLKSQGISIHVVCPGYGDLVDSIQCLGIEVTYISYLKAVYPKVYSFKSLLSWPFRFLDLLLKNHLAEKELTKLVKIYRPDIIHTNVGVLRVGYYVAKRIDIPHVWHIRETALGINSHHYPSKKFQCKLLRNNLQNICITKAVQDYYDLSNGNSKVIYDGVFSSSFTPLDNCDSGKKYFLFVGRVDAPKGADCAFNAFMRIASKYPDVQFLFAGPDNSPLANSLKNIANGSSSRNQIKFLGIRNDIYQLMSDAMAVIVPSVMEGFGFVTVEAMLNKTLVVGRDVAGTKEQFDNGKKLIGREIGLRFKTEEELTSHMETICREGVDSFSQMKEDAFVVVNKLYTQEHNVEQILNTYKELI